MTLWSPWGRELAELGAGGCYFAGSERSQFGIQRQFNQLISSLSLVHKHCARWSCTVLEARPLWWNFQLMMEATETACAFHSISWAPCFFGKALPRVHLPDRFDCVIVPSTLRWAIADIICRFSHVRWIFTQLPIKPRCTSISDKDFQLTALWGEMTHFYQPRIAMAPRRLIASAIAVSPNLGPPGRVVIVDSRALAGGTSSRDLHRAFPLATGRQRCHRKLMVEQCQYLVGITCWVLWLGLMGSMNSFKGKPLLYETTTRLDMTEAGLGNAHIMSQAFVPQK